jgi:hypothetical protein
VEGDLAIKQLEAEGKLTLHQVTTDVKGPMWQALIRLIADMNGKKPSNVIHLVEESEIHFAIRDGRFYHDGQRIGFPEIDRAMVVQSQGSVGIDETLDIRIDVPWLRKDKIAKGLFQCIVTGTLNQPTLAIPDASLVVQLKEGEKAALMVENVKLNFSVEETKNGRMLNLAPVTIFEKQKLTPELCGELLPLIVPTLSDLTGVQGEVSLSFDSFRVPLGVPKDEWEKKVELVGKLQLHQVSVSTKTPMLETLVKVLADMYGKKPSDVVQVVKNAEVNFKVRDGRMYHEGLRFGFPDISPDLLVTSRGYVGIDKSLDIELEVPSVLADKKEFEIKKGPTVKFRITGTIDKPTITAVKNGLNAPIIVASMQLPQPVRGQALPAQKDEVKAVVRISKRLIEDVVAREEIVAAIPFNAKVLRFTSQGVMDGRGKAQVDLSSVQDDATFVISSHGSGESYVRGVRGPIVATGAVSVTFATRSVVRFDGRKFSLVATTPQTQLHGQLDSVAGRRGGPAGRAAGRLLRPVGQRLVPRAEAEATPISDYYLKNFMDELAGRIVAKLDHTTPVEKSLHRLFPETRDWVIQLSTNSQFLQAAYGPKGAAIPALPENPAHMTDDRLELWIHSTTTEAQDLVKLSKEPLIKNFLNKYLETVFPELAALTENHSLVAVGPWLVVSIGAPKANKLNFEATSALFRR